MDRPPPDRGTGRFPTGPGRPGSGEPAPASPPEQHGYDDPDPASRRPDLYRPLHTGPDSTEAVPADSMPTEPIAVTTDPLPIPPVGEQSGAAPRYEGNWADWMSPEGDTEQPPEAAETPSEPAPEPSGVPPAAPPETPPSPAHTPAPDATPATAGATAQQRLRDRLVPPDDAAPVTDRPATRPARTRLLPVVLGVVGVAALAAAAYVQFAVVDGDGPAAPAATPQATAPPPAAADPNCPAGRTGNTVQGNGPGGTDSGAAAIFGFQHAYYVERSGAAARELVTPDATVPAAADIQQGIDSIPAETTHCIQISPGAFVGQYHVVITEYRPEAAPVVYNPQFVTTRPIGDRTLIHGIGPMP